MMKKGFTLIELLVVIAIIGILSSIALVNLNSARDRARLASVQGSLASVVSAVVLCQDSNSAMNCGTTASPAACATTGQPADDAPICVVAGTLGEWPELEDGWVYDNTADDTVGTDPDTFTFAACEGAAAGTCTVGGDRVVCTQLGCTLGTAAAA